MSERILFNCTHGREDPERAILPFVAANVAATAGLDATVVCTVEAVWLGTRGGAEGVASKDLPPLPRLLAEFRENGGKIWLCGACTKPRGITEAEVAEGAAIVGAATIVEAIAGGASTVAFA
jgi:predicted peroxiredoxin